MPQNYEIADFDTHTPFRCAVHHIGDVPQHMHDFFEILFLLSGTCRVSAEEQMYVLEEGDLLIVESRVPHALHSSDCVYASVQLDQTALENTFPVPMHPSFECNSTIPGKGAAYEKLRRVIAELILNNTDAHSGYELRNWILIYRLMDVLYTYFRVERPEAVDRRNHRYAQRIAEISSIINARFTGELPLSEVADLVHLSVPYLSKFFQEQFGMNYLSYLTQLRINKAVHELMNTEKTIEEVSADSGFPNSHAFTKAFQKEYGMMPSVYRRRARSRQKEEMPLGIRHSDYLMNLRKYLDIRPDDAPGEQSREQALSPMTVLAEFDAGESSPGKVLRHTWKETIAVGKAEDILQGSIQDILRRVQREIGFRYLFFNGILSDEMHVCSISGGRLVFNFAYVDRVLDFLLQIGLLPALSFSYMPSVLAKRPDRRLFSHLVSEPKNLTMWQELIEAFMKHAVERYGQGQVSEWRFCVWHQPNTTTRLYGFEKDESFYEFYKATRQCVKQAVPGAAFGFPAIFQNADFAGDEWYQAFLDWCREQDCMPDFLNFTYYDTKLSREERSTRKTFGFVFTMVLNDEPDGFADFVHHIRRNLKQQGMEHLPVYLSEWNNTPSQQDLLNDTCFKSCYLVKNILENYDRLDSFSYWSLSDLMSETQLPEDLLFGGLGLFTVNGMPKASYYALWLLAQLKNSSFLASRENWYAVRTDRDIRIIAYHYIHFSKIYASGERFIMTPEDRYTMFRSIQPLHLTIHIRDIPAESDGYQIREYLVGRRSGSLYDAWMQAGAGPVAAEMDKKLLEAASMPRVSYENRIQGSHDGLKLTILLDPLDVKLLVINW